MDKVYVCLTTTTNPGILYTDCVQIDSRNYALVCTKPHTYEWVAPTNWALTEADIRAKFRDNLRQKIGAMRENLDKIRNLLEILPTLNVSRPSADEQPACGLEALL